MSNMKGIKHKVYFSGKVQSWELQSPNGQKITVGRIMPGKYDFGIAKQKETIYILYGTLIAKKTKFRLGSKSLIFKPGTKIIVSCVKKPVFYLCFYD